MPFYWVFPGAWIMFFAQSLAIGAGAIPVFLYGRKRLGSEWFALVGAATYLLHPAVSWTNLENFHPDAFLGVFVGFAIYAALESQWRLYVVFVVLSLLVKEDASLVHRAARDLGGDQARPAHRADHHRRQRRLHARRDVPRDAQPDRRADPQRLADPVRRSPRGDRHGGHEPDASSSTTSSSEERPWYLWQMTAPFAWLFLRLPSVAAISALVLFTNILSTFWYQHQIEYHYSLIAVPALAIGTVYAIGAVRERVEWSGSTCRCGRWRCWCSASPR